MLRAPASVTAALVLAAALAVGTASPALAAIDPGPGTSTSPAQPYLGNPNPTDWIGAYTVDGENAWQTEFALTPPDENEALAAPLSGQTKWGTAPDPTRSALLTYLLWRYGDTTDNAEAAALSHIIYSSLSGPTGPGDLSPANDFRHIAYDDPFHLSKLSAPTQTLVGSMLATPTGYFAPWTALINPPAAMTVGVTEDWLLHVQGTGGIGVPSVSVVVTLTGATLPGGATSATFVSPSDGSPLLIPITPTATTVVGTMVYERPTPAIGTGDPIAVDVSPFLRRSDNVATSTISFNLAAAPGAPAGPTGPVLAQSGPNEPAWPAAVAGLLTVLVGIVLVRIGYVPPRRRAHRA